MKGTSAAHLRRLSASNFPRYALCFFLWFDRACDGKIWNASGEFEAADFVAQARRALANVVAVLAEAGGLPEHIVRMTWYVVDKREYIASYAALGRAYIEVIGRHYPAMTAVQVAALIEDAAKVEIEATAVIPDLTSSPAPSPPAAEQRDN